MMWKERHREHFQGGSQGCDLTARAHDFLWISQRHFQSSSSPSASFLPAVVLSICCGPILLPCPLPFTRVGGLLPAYAAGREMHFCRCSWKEDCKGALSFLPSQLLQLPELVQGQDGNAWQEQAGHQAAIELHLLVMVSHLAESCQGRGRRSCSSSSLLPQPPAHSPWDGSSNQIALGQINSENWPSGNLTLHINKYANKRTVCCQICQPVNWADSP